MKALVGIDCGLTTAKAAVFDTDGNKLSLVQSNTPLNGMFLNAEVLWSRIADCVRQAVRSSGIHPKEVIAVGLSGHGNGLYALDEAGIPITAVSSMYNENQSMVDEFYVSSDYNRFYELTNQSCWAGQPMQILRHFKKMRPELYGKIQTAFMCKDFLRYKLTA